MADGAEEHPRTKEMWFPKRKKEGDIDKVLLSNCDNLARESYRIWLRIHLWYGDISEP